MRKLGALAPNTGHDPQKMANIVNTLFPTHQLREPIEDDAKAEEIPPFRENELQQAVRTLKNKKAPGPDGIPAEVPKVTVRTNQDMLLHMYKSCFMEGIFPKRWKKQRLILPKREIDNRCDK